MYDHTSELISDVIFVHGINMRMTILENERTVVHRCLIKNY